MKQFFCTILSIALLSFFVGCTNTDEPQTTPAPTTEATTEPTEFTETVPAVVIEQRPMLALSLPVVIEGTSDADVRIFEHVYQNIDLILSEPEVAEKVIIDFLNRTDTAANAERISKAANKAFREDSPDWITYRCQITYAPMRLDAAVLSLYGSRILFSGLKNAEAANLAVSYDLTTGEVLKLTKVLPNISRDDLCQLIIEDLEANAEENQLFDEYADTVKSRFSGSLAQETDWYFSNEGLCFFFSPYEIAPNAAGYVVATVPYSKLAGKMDDAFFPPEEEPGIGMLSIRDFDQDAMNDFTQYAEIVLAPDGKKQLLYTDQSVTNVILEIGTINPYNNEYMPEYTVFSTPTLTPGDAVMVEYDEQSAYKIRVGYNSGTERYYEYLTPIEQNHS